MIGFIVFFIFFLVWGVTAWRSDRKEWNGGICAANGKDWVLVDRDSQGGRMYRAGDGKGFPGEVIPACWISWPFID